MVIVAVIFIIVFLLAAAGFFVFALDAVIRGHDLPTSPEAVDAVVALIREHRPNARTVYDLGAGRGTFSLRLKKAAPTLEVYAVDKSRLRTLVGKIKARLLRREVSFVQADIFKTDLKGADVVYLYVWWTLLPPLERHLRKILKPGAIVITNTSYFPIWQPAATHQVWPQHADFERLFVYRV